ncbi:hypothetical protein E0539_11780 [Salmonella enterica subsp. enterica serovar Tilene]|nr:hypothetical protein [Salmonella enterica subsp. enterica serovar Tilene]
MANIYTGNGLKVFYNEDTANRLPQNAGNEQISEIAAMPTLHIAAAMAQVETYDSEYVEQLAGEQNVDPVEITVNYIPSDDTHKFLDEATETQKEFQLILIRRHTEGTLDYSLMNGRISAAALSGDKDAVVQKTYTFTPTEMIVRDATALASKELYEGSYGVGSNGVDVPQYEPVTPTGNSFIKVPADQAGNPVSADMMGIGLIDGNTFSSLAMTKSGSLAIYAKNQSTAWTRILTSNLGDSKYVALTGDQSIDGTKTFIKGIYVDSLTASNGISGKSLTVAESITGESITVDNSTLGTAQADNLTLGQPLSVANGGTGSKNATDARSALGVKAAGTFDIVPIANGGTNASTALQARINLGIGATAGFEVLPIENGGTGAVTALGARTNLDVYSKAETDGKYLDKSKNLSDLTNASSARTNMNVYSKVETDGKYLDKSNNLSDLSDRSVARSNLNVQGVKCVTSTVSGDFNALSSPDDNLNLLIANDGTWGVQSQIGEIKPLLVERGGTGATNPANARINLSLDRFNQADNETYIQSPDKLKYLTIANESWGYWNTSGGWMPLGLQQGGTGATTAEGARWNLNINRLVQATEFTLLNAPDNTRLVVANNKEIQFQDQNGIGFGLPITAGGTGATTINGARDNLNLGTGNDVDFRGVNAHNWSDSLEYPSGGFLTSTLYNTSNGVRAIGRMYSEIPPDGIPKIVIQSTDNAGRNAYMSYDVNGLLQGIGTLSVNSLIHTPTIAVTDNMSVGTPGNAQALGPRSIAIGDSDTGLKQRSDGVLDVYTDSISVSTFTPSGFRTSRVVNVETPDGDTRGVYVSPARNGGSNALIAGPVQGVDYWEGWRDTATGMLVEFPRQGMIAGIWKATHWGTNHVAAMQVYYPSDGSAWVTRLVTGGASWYFSGDGVASGQQWVSTSDIRLKSNIEPIKGALDKLKQIKGYTYDKKNSLSEDDENVFTTHEAGLIAQEVQEVLPEAVVETSEDKLLAVNSYAVQALQINAIKELDVKVEAQAETIAVLSTQIENQQQQIDELKALVQQLLNK